jgi:aspartyl/asparaginyl beta-hydroxylase (cupin superfamily)
MNTATAQNQGLVQEAVAALQAGNAKKAREVFERVVAAEQADTTSWLGLAFACAQLGDESATLGAVNKALELEPQNLRAIIFKADHLENHGESGQALEFYQHALRLAAKAGQLPNDVIQGLQRAQQACARKDEEYRKFLVEKMQAKGFSARPENRRFRQSLDIIFDSKEIFYQEPRRYYFPGLPQIQFYERDQFDWIESIEAATKDIRAELEHVMSGSSRFKPYLQSDATHLNQEDESLVNSNDWGALFLWDYGRLVPENASLFPKTVKALEAAPMPKIPGQAPMALFSKLTPGTRIPPHNGLLNTRLICHLPLIVPENCGALRVGNEERPWVEGEMLVFDDSMEHEAWNTSEEERVVLLFEIWRPELSDEEQGLVTSMLAAVKEYYDD